MEGAMLLQKSAIPASTMLLDNCTHTIEQGNYEEALNICIQFFVNKFHRMIFKSIIITIDRISLD